MVLTHPDLEAWHKDAIRKAIGDYKIGIIFVPLFRVVAKHDDELEEKGKDELPVLRPLDPRTISGFTSFDALRDIAESVDVGKKLKYGNGKEANLEEEMVLEVDIEGTVEEIIEEVTRGVLDVMSA